jgi:hypothetical protein
MIILIGFVVLLLCFSWVRSFETHFERSEIQLFSTCDMGRTVGIDYGTETRERRKTRDVYKRVG